MNIEEGLKTPNKAPKPASTSSPSTNTRGSAKRGIKNAKITNFFTKVNSPQARNNSNSNQEHSENDNQQNDEFSKDTSSNSMKLPDRPPEFNNKSDHVKTCVRDYVKEYVFITPSSDDDTNISGKGSTSSRRRKPPSVNSNNSRSCDGMILVNANNELAIAPKKRSKAMLQIEKVESNSNHETPSTPTRSSGRDSRSRDSLPEKRMRTSESACIQAFNQNSGPKITRIQPTKIGSRTKMIDFQSVPSDLNLPRDQAQELIQRLFLVKMPDDFYLFWEFAKTINHRKPCSAFSHAFLEWNLVGPYDVLSGLITDFHGFSKENLLRHCRFYYDTPEFQTLIVKKDANSTHYGYYRDEPEEDKPIVVMNKANLGGQLHEVGDNLFTLFRNELDTAIGTLSMSSQEIPPLTSSSSKTLRSRSNDSINKQSQLEKAKAKQELTIMRDKLFDFCVSHENLSCDSWSKTYARRTKQCAKTLNDIGILVPRKDHTDYKGLGMPDDKLQTMLTRISEFNDDKTKCGLYKDLREIIDKAESANNENDSAMSLELGLDLFFNGDSFFHNDVESLLTKSYSSLGRNEFTEILKSHLAERKKGDKVSLLD